jgi:synaptobrevin family protein YKT6
MKILYLGIYHQYEPQAAVRLASASDFSSFGYFARSTISEHVQFAARTIVQRTAKNNRTTVSLDENSSTSSTDAAAAGAPPAQSIPFVIHSYVRYDGLAAICVVNTDYNIRVAFGLLNTLLNDYEKSFTATPNPSPATSSPSTFTHWNQIRVDIKYEPGWLKTYLETYQNPLETDKMLKIQASLDEIKGVMSKNIEALLERGEKLDDLMQKSEDLSSASVTFYKQSKKANSCCKYY